MDRMALMLNDRAVGGELAVPCMRGEVPGPQSVALHARAARHIKGYSSQVRLFPVVFESGSGVTLRDVDGNVYLDFSSGIYVTGLGHCHPKVTEAVQRAAATLMNAHDFTTPQKVRCAEMLAARSMGDLDGVQLYDAGTAAVEAALRIARAATGRFEFLSFHRDFHGKTMGAVSLGRLDPSQGPRAPGFVLAPRPDVYRRPVGMTDAEHAADTLARVRQVIAEETSGRLAGIVLEPIQGWAGTIIPPDGFIQGLRALCDELGALLIADEVLTGLGRTGKMFAMEHWDTLPDVMTLGKQLGNGFPVSAVLVRAPYMAAVETISASTSYGGNPMACAAAVASLQVIEDEGLVQRSAELGGIMLHRLEQIRDAHPIVGDVRGKGLLQAIELVKNRDTREPFEEAGRETYRRAFGKGLAWIPAGHILRLSPPMVMTDEQAMLGLDIIEEAIAETEVALGFAR
jgi:4-aminobutyrate aminotransferase-like enzyme